MVTIESDIFTEIATDLRSRHSGIFLSGEYLMQPTTFPAVSIEEADNYDSVNQIHNDGCDHSVLMYEINVYTNKTVGKKAQAKKILAEIDDVLTRYNFTRLSAIPVPNMTDTSIYRISARYRAETDGTNVYRYGL